MKVASIEQKIDHAMVKKKIEEALVTLLGNASCPRLNSWCFSCAVLVCPVYFGLPFLLLFHFTKLLFVFSIIFFPPWDVARLLRDAAPLENSTKLNVQPPAVQTSPCSPG